MKNFLYEKNVDILDWHENSPDLNLIKNLWHVMKNEVAGQYPTNKELLKTAVKIVWTQKMISEYCCNFINSMPRRMATVVKIKGDDTKY